MNGPQPTHETPPTVGLGSSDLLAVWPKDRREELALLQELIREARTINHGSNATARILRCEEIADQLSSIDLEKARDSFWNFLVQQAAGASSANDRDDQRA